MTPMAAARIARALDLIQRGRTEDGVVELRHLMLAHGHQPPFHPDTRVLDRRRPPTRPRTPPTGGRAA